MIGHQLAHNQRDQTKHTQRREYLNVLRRKPILALSRIQHDLQRPDPQRQKSDPPKIHPRAIAAFHVVRIEHKLVHQEQRQRANRKVQIKNPAPAVVVGDPSAERRPKNRRQQNADAERRHGVSVTLLGKSFQQNRLRQRLQSAARQPLQNSEDNQLRQRRCQSAAQRRHRESRDARQ